ncbi:hypothetical protein SPONN_1007 [uncultured Candidatus Thioglobus sp.]|nr:hypothetical protein SPONN_1007 [uncultured Candidatus Thioglobus sp.]
MKLIEDFQELVPDSMTYNVGYFEGQQHSKIWLASNEDFATMYRKYPKGEITLWCDGRTSTDSDVSRKKPSGDKAVSKRQDKESDIDDINFVSS